MTTKEKLEAALYRIERLEDVISKIMWHSREWPRVMVVNFDQETIAIRKQENRNSLCSIRKWRKI